MSESTPDFYVHPQGLCESSRVGARTRIWAFTHVLPNAVIGRDCNIGENVFIENDVMLGDRVTVKAGVQLWDGVTLEDDVFVGPNATFTNDRFPRSKQYPEAFSKTIVRHGASIGANATILPGLTIGSKAMVGAGAVVTHSVPPNAIVVGNPARIVGYADSRHLESTHEEARHEPKQGSIQGVTLLRLPVINDLRGTLSVVEFGSSLPFTPRRVFFVYDVPSQHIRGEHAHRECHQLLVCLKGSCSVVTDDGQKRDEWHLTEPSMGLHVEPMVWAIQYKYSSDALLMVFASHPYDPADYIRDYDQFCMMVKKAI